MKTHDIDQIEEIARRFSLLPNDEDGKTLAAFVLAHVRTLYDENERFRTRIDAFEQERPTSPELKSVTESGDPVCGTCGGRTFRLGQCVACRTRV